MITLDEARARVKPIADANPDFVYEPPGSSCVYFNPDGSPSCILGHAFADELRAHGVTPTSKLNDTGFSLLALAQDFTEDARTWLRNVQRNQDCASTWGTAVEQADLTFLPFRALQPV